MRFVTFEIEDGLERFGFVAASGEIFDLEGAFAAKLAVDPFPY